MIDENEKLIVEETKSKTFLKYRLYSDVLNSDWSKLFLLLTLSNKQTLKNSKNSVNTIQIKYIDQVVDSRETETRKRVIFLRQSYHIG